jgi:hypothetical protein
MTPRLDCAQLELHFGDQMQGRYALIRPLVLFAEGTPPNARRKPTPTPIRSVPLLAASAPKACSACCPPISKRDHAGERHAGERLKALYAGFHSRARARILVDTFGSPIHHKTVKQVWEQSPVVAGQQLDLWDSHTHPDRYQARQQGIKLYYQGWDKVSIRHC